MVVTPPIVPRPDPASGVPLYLQLERFIGQRIESGEWQPGEQIPSEDRLCEAYGVSRITMRQAVTRLVTRGLLIRVQGRGTFVRDTSLVAGTRGVTSFTEELQAMGMTAGAHVLDQQVVTAGAAGSAAALQLAEDAPVLVLRRLRTANGLAMGVQVVVLPLSRFPGLEQIEFEDRSLYETLEKHYGVVAFEASETFTVGGASKEDAVELGVEENSHVFKVERLTLDSAGPFEHVRSVMRGDRYQIRLSLRRP